MNKEKIKENRFNEIYGEKGYQKTHGLTAWFYSKLKGNLKTRSQAVFELLGKGDCLLDIGCGNGSFCVMVKDSFNEIYGLDVSSVNIHAAKEKVNDRTEKNLFHFIQHDMDESLPFPDNYFDTVTCIATLECLLYPPSAIVEMKRVLKPQGVLIIQIENIAFLPLRFGLLFGKLPTAAGLDEIGVDWDRLHSFTRPVVIKLLEKNGFVNITLTCSGIFSKARRIWPSLLGGDIIAKASKNGLKDRV